MIGGTVAGVLLFIVIPVIICIVMVMHVTCADAAGSSSRHTIKYTTHSQLVIPTLSTSYVTTTTSIAPYQKPTYPLESKTAVEAPPHYSQFGYPPQDQAGSYPSQDLPIDCPLPEKF